MWSHLCSCSKFFTLLPIVFVLTLHQMMPFDTAKSRYQKDCLSSVERPNFPEYSWIRNFKVNYPGFTIVIVRSALTHGVFFLVYESIKRHIEIENL